MSRIFLDTNVLVYPYDSSEPAKQAKALQVLDEFAKTDLCAISTQILSEFLAWFSPG